MKKAAYLLLTIVLVFSCTHPNKETEKELRDTIENPTNTVLLSSEIVWEKLNPARGDQSPQAGTIWGDRKGTVPTGFLAKFVDGFSSPAHIHNVTYRAVVIEGLVHNDDPDAENMWMSSGSFWTQVAGQSHITSAKGEVNIALVEIDHGPYLVKPISEAFYKAEKPINIDVSNVVWLNDNKTNWVKPNSVAEISFLLGSDANELKSLFVKLPQDYKGKIESNGTVLHAVVIQGELAYKMPKSKDIKNLDTGSYFGATDKAVHNISNLSEKEVLLYVRTNGDIKVH
jgi:hypothetical protein